LRDLLRIKDLTVAIGDKVIVRKVNLSVGRGEMHVIMGPNAAGKSTLLAAIMGLPRTRILKGSIIFEGVEITNKPCYERAKMGIALAHQIPPAVKGVRFSEVAKALIERCGCSDHTLMAKMLRVDKLLERDLFVGFSGGERKRAELYLTMIQGPKLALLDEPDSGVDLESLSIIANVIEYLIRKKNASIILVTHSGAILEKLSRISKTHIMINGEIVYSGYPDDIIPIVTKFGYRKSVEILLGDSR